MAHLVPTPLCAEISTTRKGESFFGNGEVVHRFVELVRGGVRGVEDL